MPRSSWAGWGGDTNLEAAKTAAPGEADVADVGRAAGGHHLIDHQRPVPEVGPTRLLHLPELLQSLHHVHWGVQKGSRQPASSPSQGPATGARQSRAMPAHQKGAWSWSPWLRAKIVSQAQTKNKKRVPIRCWWYEEQPNGAIGQALRQTPFPFHLTESGRKLSPGWFVNDWRTNGHCCYKQQRRPIRGPLPCGTPM